MRAVNAYIQGVSSYISEKKHNTKWLWVTAVVLGLISAAAAAAFFGIDQTAL